MIKTRADQAKQLLEHALADGDDQAIESVIMQNLWLLYSWHHELLLRAISTLGSATLDRNPLLRILHPVTPVLSRANGPSAPVFTADGGRQLNSEQRSFFMAAQIVAARVSGNEEVALRIARQLHSRLADASNELPEHPDGPLWYLYLQIGSTFLAAGETSRALVEFAVASQLAELSSRPEAERFSIARTALTHAVRGSLGEAERMLQACRAMPEPAPPHRKAIFATENVTDALIHIDYLSPTATEAIDRLESAGSMQLTWHYALLARVRYYLAMRRPEFVLETLQHARDTHPTHQGRFTTDIFESALIDAHILVGELHEAGRVVRSSERTGLLTRLALIRLALHTGDYETAARRLHEVTSHVKYGVTYRIEVVLLTAWVQYSRTGKLDKDTAERLLQYGLQQRNRRLFASLPLQLIDAVKQLSRPEEIAALEVTLSGLSYRDVPSRPKLTSGELRVLNVLTQHTTTAEIAEALFISPNTVKSHLQSLYRKFGCSTREEAIEEAARMSLIESVASTQVYT